MSKFRTVLLALLVSTGSALGQGTFGIKAGVCLPKLHATVSSSSGSGSGTTESLVTFVGGLYLKARIGERTEFQPEVLYAQMGGKNFLPGIDLKMTYISVPLIFKFYGGTPINFQVGPQFSYLLESQLGGSQISGGLNQFDFGGVFGAGYDSGKKVSFDFRYVIGITNMLDTKGAPAGSSLSMTHQALQLTLGIALRYPTDL